MCDKNFDRGFFGTEIQVKNKQYEKDIYIDGYDNFAFHSGSYDGRPG